MPEQLPPTQPSQHNFGPHEAPAHFIPKELRYIVSERNAAEKQRELAIGELAAAQSALRDTQEALDRAEIDPVTGLPTRQVFEREYESLFYEGGEERRNTTDDLGVVVVDLNGLHDINKELGLQAGGDRILHFTAAELKRAIRPTDKIYRYGGDEMVIVLNGLGVDKAKFVQEMKERLKQAGDKAAAKAEIPTELPQGVSVGLAVRRKGDTPQDTLRMANIAADTDKALYKKEYEKRTGKRYGRS